MVRSPALVFQEMAVKGAQGKARGHQRDRDRVSLVDYADDDDDDVEPTAAQTSAKSKDPAPTANGVHTPPPSSSRSVPPDRDDSSRVETTLGSPFTSIRHTDDGLSVASSAEPPPQLRLLGEKRRREAEEEDQIGLLSSAGSGGPAKKVKVGAKVVPSQAKSTGLASKLKINLSKLVGGDRKG